MQHPAIGHDDAKSPVTLREMRNRLGQTEAAGIQGRLMTELILFYALLSIPVLMGLAYSVYSYRKFKLTKHRT
jgi:hypothetical protein